MSFIIKENDIMDLTSNLI